uniref:Atrophin-1 multi-domain protein n=1 Tax=Caenorhabditis tropicalis TaxID=1561998 RepID=A0A1I7UZ92_9PELO
MKTSLLLTVASLATVLAAKPATTEEVKTDAAAGRYNRRPSYGNSNPGYGNGGGGYPSYGPGYWQPLVQDRFVCDLDASVLLVVDSNRHHHHNNRNGYYGNPSVPANRAVRVKCSEVANHDEDSCNFCCQQTARRDTTLANDKLFGFLAITKTDDDETFKRDKRDASPEDDDDDDDDEGRRRGGRRHGGGGRFHKVDPTYVVEADWNAPKYHTNVKCVCCAPRPTPAAQNPSTYNNPSAASNPSGYNNGNTFNTQPVPVNTATAAQQPLVDSWQSSDSTWSSDAPAAATNTGNTWQAPQAAPSTNWQAAPAAPSTNWQTPSADTGANWGAASDAAAPAPPPAVTPAPIAAASNTY